jgi:hypothetical protein
LLPGPAALVRWVQSVDRGQGRALKILKMGAVDPGGNVEWNKRMHVLSDV